MGQKLSLASESQDTSFSSENTIHNFFLRHSVFTIYDDWPQESTQTHKFIHHETGPQYGGRCVGCAYFVNSDDPQILLGTLPKKKTGFFWEFFPKGGGGGLCNSQNYFIFTVSFFVCRNIEVLGGSRIPKSKNMDFFGGSPIPKTFEK